MSFSWGSGPTIPVNVASNISRSGMSYSGYVTVSLGAVTGKSTFGYYIEVTVDGTTKRLKDNYPNQWSSGAYSASFPVSGSTTASTISVAITMGTNAPRGSSTYYESISIGAYSSGDSGGGDTPAGASVPTISRTSMKLGETVTIYTNRTSSRHKHTITYSVGGKTGTIAEDVTLTAEWTPSAEELLDSVKSGSVCTISVVTLKSGVEQGMHTVKLTLYPPDDAKPAVLDGWYSVARDNSGITDVDAWVKGYSRAKVTFDSSKVTAQYGGTIEELAVVYGGKVWPIANGSTVTVGPLAEVDAVLVCRAVDNRGLTTRENVTIPVLDYSPPTVQKAAAYRCDAALLAADTGKHIAAKATAGCTSLDGKNSVVLTAAWKALNAESFSTAVTLQNDTAAMVTGNVDVDTKQSYVVRLTATDKLGNQTYVERTVTTQAVTFHLKSGGNGAAFGKYAETDNCLDCEWSAKFAHGVEIAESLTVGGKTLAEIIADVVGSTTPETPSIDSIYPVGSIYMSANNTDPAQLWPGTYWQQIEGKFLLGASETHPAGDTGGAETVVLEEAQIPAHSHGGTTGSTMTYASFGYSVAAGSGSALAAAYQGSFHEHSFTTDTKGGGQAHNNMPPYLAVYIWQRIAAPEV